MNLTQCESKLATIEFKDGKTDSIELMFGRVRSQSTTDGFCRVIRRKAVLKGLLPKPEINYENVKSITCDDESWEVYAPPQYGCDHCKFMWVFRMRRLSIPCEEPSQICECYKDPDCDGGFFATEKFVTNGRVRKMNLAERVADKVRQNVWTYRYYSTDLMKICELTNLRRLLIKHDGQQFRITRANFDGDCPYAEIEREKSEIEIVTDG